MPPHSGCHHSPPRGAVVLAPHPRPSSATILARAQPHTPNARTTQPTPKTHQRAQTPVPTQSPHCTRPGHPHNHRDENYTRNTHISTGITANPTPKNQPHPRRLLPSPLRKPAPPTNHPHRPHKSLLPRCRPKGDRGRWPAQRVGGGPPSPNTFPRSPARPGQTQPTQRAPSLSPRGRGPG